MPVPLRTTYHRAEAKYNVTTEFPSLGLHSAAATGNIGLVEYALDHGQPINSVLDGVLPLHAACAGGNVQVVKLLIDHGADVNAPRLPRRYSNDKNRDASAPIVGTSGSTPLHFAAANGNTNAVTLLLLHGAHANHPDKHGVTPEMLARQNGWLECADVLRQWVLNKDRDLRERPGAAMDDASAFSGRERLSSVGTEGETSVPSTWRRLHVKQSIDTALNRFKTSTPQPPFSLTNNVSLTPPASPTRSFGEYAFYSTPPSENEQYNPVGDNVRRPSLPQTSQLPPIGLSRSRKTSTPTLNSSPSPRRPRSAGTGAESQEQEQEPNYATLGKPGSRRLGSKLSLMNILKKAQGNEPGQSVDGSQSLLVPSSPPSFGLPVTAPPLSTSPNSSTPLSNPSTSNISLNENPSTSSTSISPFSRAGFYHKGGETPVRSASGQLTTPLTLHRQTSSTLSSSSRSAVPLAVDLHNALAQQQERQHRQQTRDRSRSTGSGPRFNFEDNTKTIPSPGSSPFTRLGLLRAREHGRNRSGSGGSLGTASPSGNRNGAVFDDDVVVITEEGSEGSKSSSRPSILKHNRTSSSGHSQNTQSGFRTLRFDPNASDNNPGTRKDLENKGNSMLLRLRPCNSAGSLVGQRGRTGFNGLGSGNVTNRVSEEDLSPESAPATITDFEVPSHIPTNGEPADEDEDEEEYGRPLNGDYSVEPIASGVESPDATALTSGHGLSFASSSQSSLSPIISNEGSTGGRAILTSDFPFSINIPPPTHPEGESTPQEALLRVPPPGDHRSRGDSVSSTSTSDSRTNPQLSASGTTSGSGGSDTVTTPWLASPGRDSFLALPVQSNPSGNHESIVVVDDTHDAGLTDDINRGSANELGIVGGFNQRRSRVPSDIDISSISSHAQAEALVQKAQKEILEMADSNELIPTTGSAGRSPLSARLAAYGESLALERKLREQKQTEERKASIDHQQSLTPPVPDIPIRDGVATSRKVVLARRDGMERQHSLEHKSGRPPLKKRVKDPRRPSTADGLSPREDNNSLSNDQTGRSHQSSLSASGFGTPASGRMFIRQDNDSPEEYDFFKAPTQPATLPNTKQDNPSPEYPRATSNRSRTPGPDGEQLSRVSSLEYPDNDTELGPPLFRVSTAPHSGPSPTRKREAKSASKLTRMGFSPAEQAGRAPTPVLPGNKRFGVGVIRSLFKGKP